MKQYKHILVPLDGSELAESALTDAFNLAHLNQAEVTLLQVISPLDHLSGNGDLFIDEVWALQKEAASRYLKDVAKREECKNLKVHLIVEMGPTAETIIDYAHQGPIDLIVMATHGRSGLQHWVFGSVAEKVLRGADLPVLLVRAQAKQKADEQI
jgi:nucleotide-binding universal stress UspA family protein